MNHQEVQRIIKVIGSTYGKILDSSHNIVLPAAISEISTSKRIYDDKVRNSSRGVQPTSWGYTIEDSQPLRFIVSKIKDVDLQVDIYCDIQWKDEPIPVKQEIKVRIWSQHERTIFNSDRDAEIIMEKLSDPERAQRGRVVSRFHFDKANPTQKGPQYHLQIGGNPREYELCWHPSTVNVPRLEYHPMELFLTCQMVAANFFWDEYLEIQRKSEWQQALALCQSDLLLSHYQRCLEIIQRKDSLLDNLWVS